MFVHGKGHPTGVENGRAYSLGMLQLFINKIEQVALNKSSLLLKIILQNTQTLQLFTKINR